jgi:hypothetical protein
MTIRRRTRKLLASLDGMRKYSELSSEDEASDELASELPQELSSIKAVSNR